MSRVADEDPVAEVRAAAQAALIAFDPPATGVLVASHPAAGSPGAVAGLRPGDIIVRYADRPTIMRMHLGMAVTAHKGDESPVTIIVIRDGQERVFMAPSGDLEIHTRAVKTAR